VLTILKNLITFSFTSLEMRHYYQSPWDLQNDTKQSLKIITFTLKTYIPVCLISARVCLCVWVVHMLIWKQGPLSSEKTGQIDSTNSFFYYIIGSSYYISLFVSNSRRKTNIYKKTYKLVLNLKYFNISPCQKSKKFPKYILPFKSLKVDCDFTFLILNSV